MKSLWVVLWIVMMVVLLTACSNSPDKNQTQLPTPVTPAAGLAQASTTPSPSATATEVKSAMASQAASTAQPGAVQTSTLTPTSEENVAPAPPTATASPTSPPCLDEAVFVGDISIPDGTLFRPGESFTKTWRVKNTGTCTWGAGYALDYVSGDIMSGNFNNPIGAVLPGELADISVDLAAPARGGEQIGFWQFHNAAGQPFGVGYNGGSPLWVKINVAFFNPDVQPTTLAIAPVPTTSPTPGSGFVALPLSPTPAALAVNPTEPPATTGCAPQQNDAYVNEMLTLINKARADNSLGPVFLQSQLTAAALKHSTDMACNRFVDHDGSDKSTWYSRVQAEGYANPRSARENIYVGADAQGTFKWWMNSPVHRDNILYPSVTEVGIGYVFLPGGPYGSYFTLVLAKR